MSGLYIIDTCSFTWAMRESYPIDAVPNFWVKLEEAAISGVVLSNEMVLMEIEKQDDDLHKWCKEKRHIFKPLGQDVVDATSGIVKQYPAMVSIHKEKDFADPFLIGHAKIINATIVTQENCNGPNHPKPKIPDICEALGIRTIKMVQLVKELGWLK